MARITRRRLLKTAGATGAGAMGVLAAPAIAQTSPIVRWRMATSWPRTLDTVYGGAMHFAEYVADATDSRFQIRVFAADQIAPGLAVTDSVSSGSVELCHTAPYYMWSKDPTFALACAAPFGLNGRMQNAWWSEGGGEGLVNAFYEKHGIFGLLAGNTMAQMGGWFRREINTPDDLKGVKMRVGGAAAAVLARTGVVPHQLAGGEILAALERGTVDAAEWVGPYDDEKLGLHKAARYYYYPGWWEGGAMLHVQINKKKWEALPATYQTILAAAAAATNQYIVARYDAQNPLALKRLVAAGTQLRPFSEAILDGCYRAANEFYAEVSGKNEDFKKIWDSIKAFRLDQYLWLQVADGTYDNYMMTQHRKQAL
jgi:TRAP-type mannitol/chloroaromatic compound transport system substrate-binding protein